MENSGENEPPQDTTIDRETAIRRLDDNGEHKFLMKKGEGTVYIVGSSVEDLRKDGDQPRRHEEIRRSLLDRGFVDESDIVLGGYCRVEDDELLFWGPSSFPVDAAQSEEFESAIEERRIQLIDQWLGEKPSDS